MVEFLALQRFEFSFPQSLWVAVGNVPNLSFEIKIYGEVSF